MCSWKITTKITDDCTPILESYFTMQGQIIYTYNNSFWHSYLLICDQSISQPCILDICAQYICNIDSAAEVQVVL